MPESDCQSLQPSSVTVAHAGALIARLAGDCAFAVMAKAPRPGEVKTRLTPFLQSQEAAQISAAFLRDITANIALAAREVAISAWLAYAPAGLDMLFNGMVEPGTRFVLADGSTAPAPGVQGFGMALLQTVRAILGQEAASVCLLNSDSPTLPNHLLVEAARSLAAPGDRIVLGPAEDGGYYLLGLKRVHPELFADIDWSSDRVAQQTLARATALNLEIVELSPWYDVDDADALRRLIENSPSNGLIPYSAPFTMAAVAQLRLAERLNAAQRAWTARSRVTMASAVPGESAATSVNI